MSLKEIPQKKDPRLTSEQSELRTTFRHSKKTHGVFQKNFNYLPGLILVTSETIVPILILDSIRKIYLRSSSLSQK